jgi:hypothetical protein
MFNSESLSDLTIVLAEEGEEVASDAPPASQRRKTRATAAAEAELAVPAGSCRKELPGHSVVLFGCSTFCKAKVTNWSNKSNGKLEIYITTPPGEPLVPAWPAVHQRTLTLQHVVMSRMNLLLRAAC